MTEIAFHVNAPDKLDYACRLLRATQKKSAQVLVLGQIDALKSLSSKLWAMSTTEFFPHCMASDSADVIAHSPIVLSAELIASSSGSSTESQVLLNLGAVLPAGFERFERLIELVGQDSEDLQAARTRWKHYKDRGYALSRYDVVSKAQTTH
jgi:DNA polymerase III subunit chi